MKPLVVHIIDRLPPDGAERLLCEVLRYRSDRFSYEVICLAEGGEFAAPLVEMGVPVTVLGKRRVVDLAMLWRLWIWLRRQRPAVVHTHLFTADTWGRLAARLAGVPVIISTVHSVNAWQGRIHRLVDRYLAMMTTRLIACTPQVEEKLVQQDGVARRRIVTLANAVDLQRFDRVSPANLVDSFGFDGNVPVAAVLGRLEAVKGQEYLLGVLALLKQRGIRLQLLLIGDGPQRQELERRVHQLGLEGSVRMAGFRRDIPQLLASVDLLVMPSQWEGLPMALLEGMAMSRPVVAHRVGGIPDVVRDGVEGLLVAPDSPQDLADALQRLIEDPALRGHMGRAARERVSMCYSAEKLSADYEWLYQQTLAPHYQGHGVRP